MIQKGFTLFLIRAFIAVFLGFYGIPRFIQLVDSIFGFSVRYSLNYTYFTMFSVAIILIFILYNKESLLNIKYYKNDLLETILFSTVSLVAFFVYFMMVYWLRPSFIIRNFMLVISITYLLYGFGLLFMGLAVFNMKFFRMYVRSILLAFLVGIIFFSFMIILSFSWRAFASTMTTISFFLLRLTFRDVFMDIPLNDDPLLSVNNFSVFIGSPCSGIVSLSLFTSLFIAILAFDRRLIDMKKVPNFFVFGILGMFAVSILRIYLLMVIGVLISEKLALNLFHTNAGWILFVIYLLIYWYYGYPYLTSQKE